MRVLVCVHACISYMSVSAYVSVPVFVLSLCIHTYLCLDVYMSFWCICMYFYILCACVRPCSVCLCGKERTPESIYWRTTKSFSQIAKTVASVSVTVVSGCWQVIFIAFRVFFPQHHCSFTDCCFPLIWTKYMIFWASHLKAPLCSMFILDNSAYVFYRCHFVFVSVHPYLSESWSVALMACITTTICNIIRLR